MRSIIDNVYTNVNNNKNEYDKTKGIITVFKEMCVKYPDNIAISFKNKKYTYKQLDHITDIVAANLIKKGISKGSLVGIYLDKDSRYVITILSVLKCGSIYMPISTVYPEGRVKHMLKLGSAKAIITTSDYEWLNDVCVDIINYNSLLIESNSKHISDYKNIGNEIAYVLFTSGSTGEPKGILIRNHSVVNLINSMKRELIEDDGKVKVIGVLSQFVFDVTVAQMYLALLTGNTLEIIPEEIKFEANELMSFLNEKHIDICEFTPLYLDMLVKHCEINNKQLLLPKYVLNVGEALPLSLAKSVLNLRNINIVNYYGPTEVCVYATCFKVNRENVNDISDVLIGKPINNVQVYVLKDNYDICDIGEVGELYISGDGVGNGYVNNDALTKKSFIKNIFEENKMMYKTGDLVKLEESGNIKYIGRIDDQIKVRGFRVEIKEIESVIRSLDEIINVRVITHNENTNKVLVAYYISKRELELDYFISKLKKVLPYYMIPTYFVPVDSFQRNINGKLDKKTLPDFREHALKSSEDVYNVELTEEDKEFLNICKEVLDVEEIKYNDNFYNLGGNSLIIMNINSILNKRWNINISISEIYKCKTIMDLLSLFRSHLKDSKDYVKVAEMTEKRVEINGFQKLIVQMENDSNEVVSENNIIHIIYSDKYIDSDKLYLALTKLIKRQNALLSNFIFNDKKIEINLLESAKDYYEYIKVKGKISKSNVKKYACKLDIENKSVFKVMLFENELKEQVLLLNVHHAVFDFMSFDIFIRELFSYYDGEDLGKLEYDYFDCLNLLHNKEHNEELSFWKEYLSGRKRAVCFNPKLTCRRCKIMQSDNFNNLSFYVDGDKLEGLRNRCKELCVTEYIAFSTCFSMLLNKYTKADDIILGTYIPGRDNLGFNKNNIIGFFTKLVPIRFKLNNDMNILEYSKEQYLNFAKILENQNTDHRKMYDVLEYEDLLKGELFKIVFNYVFTYKKKINDRLIKAEEIGSVPKVLPLYITIIDHFDFIEVRFTYVERLFEKEFIEQIIKEYKNIIGLFLENNIIRLEDI